MSIDSCHLIELPQIMDDRGNLTFIENYQHIPFAIQRIYYLYDMQKKTQRGAHAHRELQQLLIALSGSFDITLNDGTQQKTIRLDNPRKGLYIGPMIWRDLDNFSEGSVCLVLASMLYTEEDYYRNYDEFVLAARGSYECPIS